MNGIDEFIRPSAMDALAKCQGRAQQEAKVVAIAPYLRDMSSPVAEQGTLGHAAIAAVLGQATAGDWSGAQDAVADMERLVEPLDPWCKDAVRACVTYGLGLLRRLAEDGYDPHVDLELQLPGDVIGIPRGGCADMVVRCIRDGKTVKVVVVDWKTGFLPQGDVDSHLQLACYAVMAAYATGYWYDVEVHLAMGRRREFSHAQYDFVRLGEAGRYIRSVADASRRPGAEVTPVIAACRYCRAYPCKVARAEVATFVELHSLFGYRDATAVAFAKLFVARAKALAEAWRDAGLSPHAPDVEQFWWTNEDRARLADEAAAAGDFVAAKDSP